PTTTASSSHPSRIHSSDGFDRCRIPQPPRFSVRSMDHFAFLFNKITIQRDNTKWWGVDFEIKNHVVKISQLGPRFKALIP
ncbi:hypothetical protein S83_070240, partial [Arachis hypogaea]